MYIFEKITTYLGLCVYTKNVTYQKRIFMLLLTLLTVLSNLCFLIAQKENSNDIQKKLYQNNKGHRRAVSLTTNIPKESSKNLLTSKNQNQKQQTSSSISNQNSANLFDRKISEEPDSFEYSEDEFYDALEEFGKSTPTEIYRLVDSKQSKQENINAKIKSNQNNQKAPESKKNNNLPKKISIKKDSSSNSKSLNMPNLNNYSEKIANHRNEHVKSLYPSTKGDKDDQNWVEFHREGDMILCRRSQETPDGRVVDPIRLNHKIDNVSAYECLWYFWDTSVRLEWEHTIESFDILERPDDHTIVLHQWHKRVWPSAKRDAVYLSTIEKYEEYDNSDKITEHDPAYIKGSTWIVTNFSVEHPAMPQIDVSKNNIVRVFINISMICQTFKKDINKPATRDNIYSKVLYISQVDPGGWVPPAALRSVYKREYPSFLKKFGKYVREQTKNKKVVKTGP